MSASARAQPALANCTTPPSLRTLLVHGGIEHTSGASPSAITDQPADGDLATLILHTPCRLCLPTRTPVSKNQPPLLLGSSALQELLLRRPTDVRLGLSCTDDCITRCPLSTLRTRIPSRCVFFPQRSHAYLIPMLSSSPLYMFLVPQFHLPSCPTAQAVIVPHAYVGAGISSSAHDITTLAIKLPQRHIPIHQPRRAKHQSDWLCSCRRIRACSCICLHWTPNIP